jgi:tryptophan-specific transport protein
MLAVALTMVVMTVSGWMLLESYQGYPLRVSFDTVTRDLLGRRSTPSTISAFISSAASCSYAYITSAGLIIDGMTGMGSHGRPCSLPWPSPLLVWHSPGRWTASRCCW